MTALAHAGAADGGRAGTGTAAAMDSHDRIVPSVREGSGVRLVSPELVGRDSEIATIGELAGTVAAGGTATLLILSEAGLGKSALLARAIAIGRRAGLRALRAECMRLEMGRALGPFVDVLSPMKARPDSVAEALELAPAPNRLHGPSGIDDRYRAHHAFARAFAALADEHPLVMGIDDLHWADEASLELFAHLSRRLARGVLLIGTYRPEEIRDRPALGRALADTRRERTWELALRRLTASDVGRALRLILGPSARVSRRSREILQASSAGNPLFLEEMLRALAQRGELERKDGVWSLGDISRLPLPRSVEEAVTERWAVLEPHTREVLALAAVIGERFRLDLLRAASGADETDLLAVMRTAVGAQLVVEDTFGGDAFAFRHALIREAILGQLLARERRILHLKVASALEAAPENDDAASLLAYHFDAAGEAHRARGYHERAGERDGRRGAVTEAIAHYERAIELAPDDDRSVAELSMRIALLGMRVLPRQLSAIQEAIRRYERLDEPRALANALLWLQTWIKNWLCWPWSRAIEIGDRVAQLVAPFLVEQTIRYGTLERDWSEGRRDRAIDALATLIDERTLLGADRGRTTLPGLGVWPLLTYFLALREIDMRVERRARGDLDLASARLVYVVEFYRKAGAPWYLERLRERAAAWRIPFPADATAVANAPRLTGREREIVLLVAKGMTNREIADRLTLSVRTAESHVERIRSKLGFRTRTQIAVWATETYGRPN